MDKSKVVVDLNNLKSLVEKYYQSNGRYPSNLTQLINEGLLNELPKDPYNNDYVYDYHEHDFQIIYLGEDHKRGGEEKSRDLEVRGDVGKNIFKKSGGDYQQIFHLCTKG